MTAISPVAWTPPPVTPLEGPFAVNAELADVELWPVPGHGPEDVALDHDGRLVTGLGEGTILRFAPDGGTPEVLFSSGGRPLGIEVDVDDRVIVCDAYRGLLRWSGGDPEVLADSYRGERFLFTNNATVASDGTIYFSVSSRRFDLASYKLDLLEHSGTGRVFAYRPGGRLELLADGLYFANGVALAGDESFLAIAETGLYRISRLWLDGPGAGERDVLIDSLPGFPDNLSAADGVFWVGVPTPRDKTVDMLAPRPAAARLVARLPDRLQPAPKRHAIVFGIDESGSVVHNLQDPEGRFAVVTAARAGGGHLYLGSLTDGYVARRPL
jgi:strictosidine synthase